MLTKVPTAFNLIGRASGIYGDFFNFYLCDLSIKVNGLQPGGPVRSVNLFQQPTGRCMLQ
jgi:phospholipid/cholesterol/gamma-HCH transport system substrate-binding protein